MDPIEKQEKKAAKKARRKQQARIKTYMETSRTLCSLGAFGLALASFLHSYKVI